MNSYLFSWVKAAGIRAIRTFAQTFASAITVGAAVSDIDWKHVSSIALVAGIYSLATSLTGLPEVPRKDDDDDDSDNTATFD